MLYTCIRDLNIYSKNMKKKKKKKKKKLLATNFRNSNKYYNK